MSSKPRSYNRTLLLESSLLGIVLLGLLIPLGRGFGPYWDTWFYYDHAIRWSAWFSSLWDGATAEPLSNWRHYFPDEKRHPPLLEWGGGLAHSLFATSLGNVSSVRLFVEFFSVLFSMGCYGFLHKRVGRGLAIVGVLLFWGSPRFLLHSVLYAIDGLIAAIYGLALLSFLVWDRGWKGKLIVYFAMVVALLTKLQALYLIPILFLWTALKARESPENGFLGYRFSTLTRQWGIAAGIVSASFATFFVLWPAMWLDFPKGVFQYLDFMTKHSNIPVLYFGSLYKGEGVPPWHYPWVFSAIALPLTLVVPALGRLCRVLASFVKRRWTDFGKEEVLLWAGVLVPLAASSLPQAPKYDGIRLLLPAYGPLAILAALEIAHWWRLLEKRTHDWFSKPVRLAVLGALGVFVLLPSIRVYPFNLVYYSPFIGGTGDAKERGFDLDYLGIAMHRLNPALAQHAKYGDILLLAGCNALVEPRAAEEWFPVPNGIRLTMDFKALPDLKDGILSQMKAEGMQVFAILSSRYSDLVPKAIQVLEEVPELDRVEYGGERLFSLHELSLEFVEKWDLSGSVSSLYPGRGLDRGRIRDDSS